MTKQNNAANVAVVADPCPNQANQQPLDVLDCIALGLPMSEVGQAFTPSAQALPSMHQAMNLACTMVAETLSLAIRHATPWRDEYTDSICAAEMALQAVQSLKAELPLDEGPFADKWFRAGSVTRLAFNAFPEKEGLVWTTLRNASNELQSLYNIVAFLDEKEGGAA